MEAGLDNSNNPFGISNGANNPDNIISQKSDGLLLNLTDNYKQNGTDLQGSDFFSNEKANGKRLVSDFDDEDYGPETDVDALDDMLSPDPKESHTKNFSDSFSTSPNNNLLAEEGVYNPFMEHQEKAAMELENLRKREAREEFEDEERMAREETPTPPADTVHDVSGLVENPADSESEDEWDYFKGDEANKENISPQPTKEVAHIPEEDDTMSQLNPNAAEFVPVSPTRSVPSPSCRMLINDQIVSQSPKKANDVDISVPNLKDFENEVKSRPSEIDANGHTDSNDLSTELMENILNGKNIDEIPEFQPGSTPKKVFTSDDFHFGPNAAPFTPKRLDQSEALSTKAVYGDDTLATFDASFNDSIGQDINILNKESDPMSMSFYADKGDANPFDLNKVQVLPDNLDDFLNKPDNEAFNETISDLPEHNPLEGETNNDDAVKIDKQSYDYEKELASPTEETDFSKTPEPYHENLIQELHCGIKTEGNPAVPADVELISPNPSPLPDASESNDLSSKDADEVENVLYKEATEVDDLLGKESTEVDDLLGKESTEVDDLLGKESTDVDNFFHQENTDLLSTEAVENSDVFNKEENETSIKASDDLRTKTPDYLKDQSEVSDLLREEIKDLGEAVGIEDILQKETDLKEKNVDHLNENSEKLCISDAEHHSLQSNDESSLTEPLSESVQPKLEEFARLETTNVESILSQDLGFERPPSQTEKVELKESCFELIENAPSPTRVEPACKLPLELEEGTDDFEAKSVSPLPAEVDESPVCEKSEKVELALSPEPIPEHFKLEYPKSPVNLLESNSPIPEALVTPDFTKEDLLEEAEERFEELCKPVESPLEETTSIKDDLSHSGQDLLSKSPIEDQVIEDSFVNEDIIDLDETIGEQTTIVDKEEVANQEINVAFSDDQGAPSENAALDSESHELPPEKLKKCIYPRKRYPPEDYEELPIDVKTETISPEFAEPAVVTPSEESKAEDLIIAATEEFVQEPQLLESVEVHPTEDHVKEPELEVVLTEPVKEPQTKESVEEPQTKESVEEPQTEQSVEEPQTKESVEEPQTEQSVEEPQMEELVKDAHLEVPEQRQVPNDLENEMTAVGVAAAVAAGAAITAVVSSTKDDDKKKSPSVSSAKKTTTTKTTLNKSPALVSKTSPKLTASAPRQSTSKTTTSKATTPKTGTTKPPTPSAPKPSPRLNTSKPKTALPTTTSKPASSKPTEKISNTVGVKKTVSEVTSSRTATSRPATGNSLPKVSQSKVSSKPSSATSTRTTIPPRTTAPPAPKVPSATAKRPTTLTSKSYSSTTSPVKTTSAVKANLSKTSLKSTTTVPSKPKQATNTITKPRIPPTRTVAKAAPDTEKQIKENVNKITASRSSAKTSTTAKTTLSSARKVESKVSSTRTTVSKTTTTTMKSTTAKKPTEIIRGPVKAKTTKIEKPKENGLSEVVTEEITILNNTNAVIENLQQEPELIKDNSPVDNKLLIETTQLVETNAD